MSLIKVAFGMLLVGFSFMLASVGSTLVYVIGQIAYKKGCLEIVIEHLKQWETSNWF